MSAPEQASSADTEIKLSPCVQPEPHREFRADPSKIVLIPTGRMLTLKFGDLVNPPYVVGGAVVFHVEAFGVVLFASFGAD
jgi:hypothetical protein